MKAMIWPEATSEKNVGPPGEIRTPDTQVRSLVLYPAELWADADGVEYIRPLVSVSFSNNIKSRTKLAFI